MAAAAIGLLSACSGEDSTPNIIQGEDSGFRGALLTREIELPDATLTDVDGEAFDLRRETADFVTLLYVGYTNCPDLCPTHMAEIAAALKELPEEERSGLKVLFVTSDPERDTPEVLREWLANFDPSFIGLTGTADELAALQRDLGMNVATQEHTEHGYEVNHASYVLAFPRHDRTAKLAYPSGMTREDYREDLLTLLGVE
ncbi:MAG: SCO family protein [Tepidiformaceae bacterium]